MDSGGTATPGTSQSFMLNIAAGRTVSKTMQPPPGRSCAKNVIDLRAALERQAHLAVLFEEFEPFFVRRRVLVRGDTLVALPAHLAVVVRD